MYVFNHTIDTGSEEKNEKECHSSKFEEKTHENTV